MPIEGLVVAASPARHRLPRWPGPAAVLGLALIAVAVPTPAAASPELTKQKNCVACHAAERKLIGPAYRDIARRYRDDQTAEARLALKIRQGGGGAWGVVKMPANPQVSEAESQALARWILGQP